jgi:hypothetical protein
VQIIAPGSVAQIQQQQAQNTGTYLFEEITGKSKEFHVNSP